MIKRLLVNAIAFYVVAYLIPGIVIRDWQALLVVAVVWGILTTIIKPILVFLTLPINIMTLGLFSFVINAILLLLMSNFVAGFEIEGFLTALLAAIALAIVNGFLSKV